MKIAKPIVFFDLETTGTDTENSRIVEIACIKIFPNGDRIEKYSLINPTVQIPVSSSDIHGITDEKVKDSPKFSEVAKEFFGFFSGCDLGGYNLTTFDVPLLSAEFVRSGARCIDWNPSIVDVLSLYRHLFPNNLSEVFKRLTGKELDGAHGATADILATIEVLEILAPNVKYEHISDIDILLQGENKRFDLAGKLYMDKEGIVRYGFGKDKGKSVKENPGFATWMLGQSFPHETKLKIKSLFV